MPGEANRVLPTTPAIAARWGFSDKAHFSRVFRARYGRSPQAYRAAVAHRGR
ncbi:helix-turn-helix domain-containing protein [Micromonospora violae]|uniref:helix-turn-helix domain-containing protein n=1 Tax=Micromonospora violae TaxID=1278207 RepID=UPI0034111D31